VATSKGLDTKMLAKKVINFGCDGAFTLQGLQSSVTVQFIDQFTPFNQGLHCVVYKCNLAFKTLESLGNFASIGKVLQITHVYFN